MCAFSYLEPYVETVINPWLVRLDRVIVCITLLYSCWLIMMLNLRPDLGRKTLEYLDPSLNKVIGKGMHTYDDDCAFTLENLWNDMDHYFVVHWCNWILSSFVIRDAYVLQFWQLFDEVIELSAQHKLPHFRECWWDHIFSDILFANIPAIILGLYLVDKMGLRRYDFLGRNGKASLYDWEVFKCHRRFGIILFQQTALLLHFVNGFFLMNAFLIPPKHFFPIARLLMWFSFGAMAHREGYVDIETWGTEARKTKPTEARYRWLTLGLLITEILIAYKYREGTGHITDEPTPWYIWLPWSVAIIVLAGFWLFLRFKPDHTVKYPGYVSKMSQFYTTGNPVTSKTSVSEIKTPQRISQRPKSPPKLIRSLTKSRSPTKNKSQ